MSDAHILQLLGLAYFATGLGVLINRVFYQDMFDRFLESKTIIYTHAYMIFAIGILLVTFHNTWEYSWTLVVTIFGWIALIKGLIMLILPKVYIAIARAMGNSLKQLFAQSLTVAIIGAALMYLGYFVL